jgi:hypothetical protein
VIIFADYQGKWITAEDYAHTVSYEHDLSLPASMVDADTLVAALSKDVWYKNADDTNGASGVFRKLCRPRTLQPDGKVDQGLLLLCYRRIKAAQNFGCAYAMRVPSVQIGRSVWC